MRMYSIIVRGKVETRIKGNLDKGIRLPAKGVAFDNPGVIVYIAHASKGTKNGYKAVAAYVCSTEGGKVKAVQKKVDELQASFNRSLGKNGAPRKSESGATTISFSVSREEKQEFEKFSDTIAKGNNSDMFRRMFAVWKQQYDMVTGGVQ